MRVKTFTAVALGALLVSVPGVACGGDDDGSEANAVQAEDFRFDPKESSIKPGDTVTWRNTGETTHNVKGPGFFSKALEPGKTYSHTFKKAGSYRYLCTLHPQQMRGTVVVGD